ncbi:hypothetical protein GCM10010168_72530 [Actinoplanes ianthinogenes]|uniref:Uncharacterized protein n=1 Tax=Actinoplanes ianthinogenes TaxID=122358 RepID=A0ABM7M692_9ACTN|nr:hypothetical protein Aiant_78150 [Actinoplanes ianthinogenes]GGR42995.1 hypothetical protein GCM10010168_72530 [Actinoplanes ianthinogenes]
MLNRPTEGGRWASAGPEATADPPYRKRRTEGGLAGREATADPPYRKGRTEGGRWASAGPEATADPPYRKGRTEGRPVSVGWVGSNGGPAVPKGADRRWTDECRLGRKPRRTRRTEKGFSENRCADACD